MNDQSPHIAIAAFADAQKGLLKTRKLRVAVDRRLYRLRNLVERCFNKLKNARRVATRLTTRPPKAS